MARVIMPCTTVPSAMPNSRSVTGWRAISGSDRAMWSVSRAGCCPDVQSSRSSSTTSAKRAASETTTAARPAFGATEQPLTPVPAGSGEALIPAASTRYRRVAPRSRAQNTMSSPWNCGSAPG
ncbi:hypothetical protein ACFQ2K_11290 [Streptomyces sanglieri]|uniref:Uncharacterized protein n=1 Tax=Streptomyces sanglieri TaxID=193460 RepID=A0ABW2WPD7_9ACTN